VTDRLDAHPEELLERERRGVALSADERETLAEHLGGCVVCRFSIQTTADFAREVPADVAPAARFDPLIQAALWSIRVAAPGVRRRARRPAPWVAAAASILLMAGAAAAAHWSGFLGTLERRPAPESRRGPRAAKAPTSAGVRTAPEILTASEPPEPPATAPQTPAIASVTHERSAPPAPRERSAGPRLAFASASAPTPAAVTRSSPSSIGRQGFAQAAAERAAGRPAAALRLYAELAGSFPLSPEGKAARVIKGRLELDRGEAGAALNDFDGYLALGSGPLEEEALVGRAEALHGLARSAEEPAAWRRLIDKFPYSAHARRAAARIAALRAQP
jgi:hypothetical protein